MSDSFLKQMYEILPLDVINYEILPRVEEYHVQKGLEKFKENVSKLNTEYKANFEVSEVNLSILEKYSVPILFYNFTGKPINFRALYYSRFFNICNMNIWSWKTGKEVPLLAGPKGISSSLPKNY